MSKGQGCYGAGVMQITLKDTTKSWVKSNLDNLIFGILVLEGLTTTELQTGEILKGGTPLGVSVTDILIIRNLDRAWKLVLNDELDFKVSSFRLLHKTISHGLLKPPTIRKDRSIYEGNFRDYPVQIQTRYGLYHPPVKPQKDSYTDCYMLLNKTMTSLEDILNLYLTLMKRQFFGDCNKRTSLIFINYLLLATVTPCFLDIRPVYGEFIYILTDYYYDETLKPQVVSFLKERALVYV